MVARALRRRTKVRAAKNTTELPPRLFREMVDVRFHRRVANRGFCLCRPWCGPTKFATPTSATSVQLRSLERVAFRFVESFAEAESADQPWLRTPAADIRSFIH